MIRFIGAVIIVCSLGIMAFAFFPIGFYLKPGHERLQLLWSQDMSRIKSNKDYQKIFANARKVELSYTDPQVAKELEDLEIPFKENTGGNYLIRIEVIRWIEGHEYGYVLQHDVFDLNQGEDEKVFELGRTYHVGIFW